jgi:hypothetical protein
MEMVHLRCLKGTITLLPSYQINMQKSKILQKREEDVQNDADQDYGVVDDTSNIYEAQQDTDYDLWISDHNVHTSISINNTLCSKCMNLLFLPENHHISILDGGADTCVLGKGWEVLSIHSSRRAYVVGFDHETAMKRNLPIVSAITAIDLPSGESSLLVIHEGIYNKTATHSLLTEFQLREFGINIDSICHRHGGTQQLTIKGDRDSNNDVLTIPLDLSGCMVHFKHRLPTAKEIAYSSTVLFSPGLFHGIRHHFLIKWQINSTSKSLRRRITIFT